MLKSVGEKLRRVSAEQVTHYLCCLYAALLALLHPLVFRNNYIDINTFKNEFFTLFTCAALAAIILSLIARWFIEAKNGLDDTGREKARMSAADIAVIVFAAVNILSCLLSEDTLLAFTGTKGRRTGLQLYLLLTAAYFIVSRAGNAAKWTLNAFWLSGTIVSLLAVLNFFLVDPLRMYVNLIPAEHELFISTVGNRNFFGALLCLYLPMCMAAFVLSEKRLAAILSGAGIVLGFAAVLAGRSDSTYIGFGVAWLILLFLSLREWPAFRRFLVLCTLLCAALLPMRLLYSQFPTLWMPKGASEILLTYPQMNVLFVLGALALVTAVVLRRRALSLKPLRYARQILFVLVGLTLLAVLLGMIYFTVIDTQTPLEDPFDILRFSDNWGNFRGYVWGRTLERFGDASWWQKLIGFGPDMFRSTMVPVYSEEMIAITGKNFDNAHNEYLQYLLTTGLLGLSAYIALIISRTKALARSLKTDVLYSAALLLPIISYAAQAVFNLNQPATTPLFFLFLGLTMPKAIMKEKETTNDSGQT